MQLRLYHNKVTPSLTPVQRLGNEAYNCKMDHCSPSIVVVVFFLSILGPLILKYTPTIQATMNDRQPDTNCCSYSVHQAQFLEGNSER